MKCHYEILDVGRDADNAEIKSAYRKLALKWHPDKNPDNTEEAKEQFQLLQQAYEVLIDPQERAWYDKHREQILRGSNSEFQDNSLDVFQYFTASCYKGYGDDEKGFYTIYRNVFDQIIKEDMEFMDEEEEIPRFGDSKSDYDSVVGPFYSYWSSYCTKKTYVWLDPYNLNEARGNRRLFKLIEKDNIKVRQKAKKERNEEVRNLVAFVRKRDRRVLENKRNLEAKALENRQKQEKLSKLKRLERKKELGDGVQADWAKFDNVKSELEEIEKSLAEEFGEEFSNSEEEFEEDNLYCVACNKIFKTPRAFQNHESSKKHKENVERLKEVMLEDLEDEEDIENLEENGIGSDIEDEILEEEYIESEEEVSIKKSKRKNKKNKNVIKITENEENLEELSCDLDHITETPDSNENFDSENSNKNKLKKNTRKNKIQQNGVEKLEISSEKLKRNKVKKQKDSNQEEEVDTDHCCVTCKSSFPSKNKLFDHLKKTGHGVYLGGKSKKINLKKK